MAIVKTAELTGLALDWAVAKCEGEHVRPIKGQLETLWTDNGYSPSTNWAQCGPIIERERITIVCARGEYNEKKAGTADCYDTYWVAERGWISADTTYGPQGDYWGRQFQIAEDDAWAGSTPLVAAMRCFVASKLGDSVEVPNELL